jgi:RHS repeat-associated protein
MRVYEIRQGATPPSRSYLVNDSLRLTQADAGTKSSGLLWPGSRESIDNAQYYTYDQAGRLTGLDSATYAYGGDGLRMSTTIGKDTQNFSWDRRGGLPLLLSDGSTSYIYGPGGLPVEQISSGGTATYYHHDQLGSTRMLTDSSGNATGTFSYAPYGALSGSTGSQTTPLGYAGQYTDPESGLQYLRARYYDPTTGQFVSCDPLTPLTRAAYGYGRNNPLSHTDPSGRNICAFGIIDCGNDDPCSDIGAYLSPLTPALCAISQDDSGDQSISNASAGAGDQLLSLVPGINPGPWIRSQLGLGNAVNECSSIYKFTAGATAWASWISTAAGAADAVGIHVPDIYEALRGLSTNLNEKFVLLPPDLFR